VVTAVRGRGGGGGFCCVRRRCCRAVRLWQPTRYWRYCKCC